MIIKRFSKKINYKKETDTMKNESAKKLLAFMKKSPTRYQVVANFEAMLNEKGYEKLYTEKPWRLERGGKYYVSPNGSSIMAFRIPTEPTAGFMLSAAHSDSPTFKIKDNPEKAGAHYVQLTTERYGGALMSTWFDRPLSVAGRVLVRGENGRIATKLVNVDRDLLIIPNVAIHMNRNANNGFEIKANVDTLPLFSDENGKGKFMQVVADSLGINAEDIIGHDLYLYNRMAPTFLGRDDEYIASPKLDDVECAFGCMEGFINAAESGSIPVCCVFDNEETGSSTKQGAASNILRDLLRRIALNLGKSEEEYLAMVAQSFMVSADNAHAQHPNHPEYSDGDNCPYMNKGIVIKFNANQKYTTDGVSAALFRRVCAEAGAPVQVFANRSDMAGGGTLGSIANTKVAVSTVDIGLPQLAMHSCYETAGAEDIDSLVKAMTAFYSKTLTVENGEYGI